MTVSLHVSFLAKYVLEQRFRIELLKRFMAIRKSLKGVITSFGIVLGTLGRKSPLLFFVLISIIGISVYFFFGSNERIVIFLTFLISLSAFVSYMYKDSYTEAFLTFFLGILTIFTIQWNHDNSSIFIVAYFLLNVVMFIGNSIKMASKIESILTRTATYTTTNKYAIEVQYRQLRKIADLETAHRQLSILERAEIIDFLSFIRVTNAYLYRAVNHIETIKLLTQSDISASLSLYKTVFIISKRLSNEGSQIESSVNTHLENLLVQPLTVSEMIQLLNQTKKFLIQKKIDMNDYYVFVNNSLHHGLSVEELISDFQMLYDRK